MINGQSGGGTGEELVFLHGGSGSWELGTELFEQLPPEVRWWGVDLPGHGDSSWTGRYALEDAADEIAAWASANLTSPAWWYGHSYGGQVAVALAGRHPELARGLVIGDTPLALPSMLALFERTGDRMRTWRNWCGRPEPELLALLGNEPAGDRTMAEMLGHDHPYLRRMAAALHRHDPAFLDATADHTRETYRGLDHIATWLSRVRGPVTLLRADPAVFALSDDTDAALVREHARDGHVRTLPGAGHGLQNFAPKLVADTLAELIR
ncbi:alpha/beta fold hydrolase [Amycolatopsis sp. CA-230715]|uniref:alpha/beta fold hydrolase n=1 Tax=Amycolatopsis sp. CA-230715 TaxID=2745196 RepID=UPI001C0198AA|nr:alpha/beta hydrolase [Amycolatopsis sp. CA-230715]QWF80077.1 2-succinyl-6-hydroxy-2,4-cyclohexadiene-1-carboxylate synthase [Amycolatopsis sp. CA-230715]